MCVHLATFLKSGKWVVGLARRDDENMSRHSDRSAAFIATAGALAYVASKVHLALKGEIGITGFYVTPEANAALDNPSSAQWGNAAVGLLVAFLCLALVRPITSRPLRLVVHIGSWLGVAMIGLGFVGFTLRAAGVTSSTDWEPTNWVSYLSLAIGWVWVLAWIVAIFQQRRASLQHAARQESSKVYRPR